MFSLSWLLCVVEKGPHLSTLFAVLLFGSARLVLLLLHQSLFHGKSIFVLLQLFGKESNQS
jgi:hypothetical protein